MLDKFPVLDSEALVHIGPDVGYVSYRSRYNAPRQIITFNKTGISILSLCDGAHHTQSISVILAERYQTSYEDAYQKVTEFLGQVEKVLPISFRELAQAPTLIVTGSSEYNSPIHAAVELTYKCNLRCRHCYIGSTPEAKEQLSLDQAYQVLEKLNSWGVRLVEFTGGEPTLHPNFPEILHRSLDYFDLVAVVTNGTHVTDEILDIIAPSKNKVVMQIDLDGANSETVDWFRGRPGTFEKEVEAIRKVSQRGILLRVGLCVTPRNLNQIEDTVALAKSLGASSIGISTVIPTGRGNDPDLLLSPEQMQSFVKVWNELQQKYPNFIFHIEDLQMQKGKSGCGAGGRSITITPTGKIKLCQMSSDQILCYGNVLTQSAKELFSQPLVNTIAHLEPPSQEVCGQCAYLGFCFHCITRGMLKGKELGPDRCKWYALHQPELSNGLRS